MRLGNYLNTIAGNTRIRLEDYSNPLYWGTLYRGEAWEQREGSFAQCEIKDIKNTTIIIDYDCCKK